MATWLAPFIVLGAVVAMYFLRKDAQAAMRHDANFYMLGILVTAAVGIVSSWRYGRDWTDYLAWGVAAVAIAASIWKVLTSGGAYEEATTVDRSGPLGRG